MTHGPMLEPERHSPPCSSAPHRTCRRGTPSGACSGRGAAQRGPLQCAVRTPSSLCSALAGLARTEEGSAARTKTTLIKYDDWRKRSAQGLSRGDGCDTSRPSVYRSLHRMNERIANSVCSSACVCFQRSARCSVLVCRTSAPARLRRDSGLLLKLELIKMSHCHLRRRLQHGEVSCLPSLLLQQQREQPGSCCLACAPPPCALTQHCALVCSVRSLTAVDTVSHDAQARMPADSMRTHVC